MQDCALEYRQYLYVANENTVVAVVCLQVLGIFVGSVDIFDTLPFIRCLTCADTHCIAVQVGLVYTQAEAVDTIAAEAAGEIVRILAGCAEGIPIYRVAALDMRPYVRQLIHRYIDRTVNFGMRIDVQTQLDNTVAAVEVAGQGIVVNTAGAQVPRRVLACQTKTD